MKFFKTKAETRQTKSHAVVRAVRRADQTLFTRGFTLIELLVVLAIFIIITSVVLARQNKFSSDILLTDLAYQVAISIRQAQVFGLGVQGSNSGFNVGYGVHFDSTPASTYKFFADTNKDGIAESSEITSTTTTTYQLQKGEKISAVCGVSGSNSTSCLGQTTTSIDTIFIRPDPSAIITSNQSAPGTLNADGTYQLPPTNTFSSAVITIVSGLGDRYRCVTVYQTGQVSVSIPVSAGTNPCI